MQDAYNGIEVIVPQKEPSPSSRDLPSVVEGSRGGRVRAGEHQREFAVRRCADGDGQNTGATGAASGRERIDTGVDYTHAPGFRRAGHDRGLGLRVRS